MHPRSLASASAQSRQSLRCLHTWSIQVWRVHPKIRHLSLMDGFLCTSAKFIEPCHEIMALFVLCKLILQTCMHSYPVGLDVSFLVGPFVCFHTPCVRTAKALVGLRRCAGLPEPSLVACVISTITSWAGSIRAYLFMLYGSTSYREAKQNTSVKPNNFGTKMFLLILPSHTWCFPSQIKKLQSISHVKVWSAIILFNETNIKHRSHPTMTSNV